MKGHVHITEVKSQLIQTVYLAYSDIEETSCLSKKKIPLRVSERYIMNPTPKSETM